MGRRDKAGDRAAKAPRRKTLTRRNAPKAVHHRGGSSSEQETEITQLRRELQEALQQQTATSEVLKVISGSAGDTKPVFEAMLTNAMRLCEAKFGHILLYDGERFHATYLHDVPTAYRDFWEKHGPIRPSPDTGLGRLAREKRMFHIPDLQAEIAYIARTPLRVVTVEQAGARSFVGVPMLKDGELIGAIVIYRQEVRPFTDRQIELLENFADQAGIAIENTRLLNELRQRTGDLSEALDQQTATSEVLKVISSSSGQLGPVFESVLANATRICEAAFGSMLLVEGDALRRVALHNAPPLFVEFNTKNPLIPLGQVHDLNVLFETRRPVHIADAAGTEDSPIVKYGGARTLVIVPMLKERDVVGVIGIYRQEVRPFTDKQIELVTNFAAQAVIAIENTRLLNELRESLQQQTATADVLKVISRSTFDLQTVLDTLLESAVRLCEARLGALFRLEGGLLHVAADRNFDERQRKLLLAKYPMPPNRGHMSGRAVLTGAAVQIPDILADEDYRSAEAKESGFRSLLGVPLLRNGQAIGSIVIYRTEAGPFTDKQLELIQTFADQAVIAIENTRLLNELRESLQQQTATADILAVISSSQAQLKPVFETIVDRTTRICEATFACLGLFEEKALRFVAISGASADSEFFHPDRLHQPDGCPYVVPLARAKRTAQTADLRAETGYRERDPFYVTTVDVGGARTALRVPLLKDSKLLGHLWTFRQEIRPFSDKQVDLVKNFAAQAVIAIENTRLLNELRESLQQQTATADVLKVISRSTFDLQTVLQTLVESAARLCDADKTVITREKDGTFYRAEAYGFSREFMDYVRDIPIKAERGSASGRSLLEGRVIHIPDVKSDPEYTWAEAQRLGDFRSILAVPMMREGVAIGVLSLTRSEVRPFTEKQIELASTFADQAAIAIENVRLFESVEARTRELAASLEDLRTTQDRLVQTQKLASLGQLTAGIAHEIKNPLNFVNNFSGLSGEMIEELREALVDVNLTEKKRSEITELMDTLRGNFDKVVQHGKRADAIVKNMLLHSREGSGEHRVVDINALVEESLNLAWHGARAEKQGFDVTLERSFDPSAGEADIFPQDITRALLNLISNGFYAAIQRKAETNGGNYAPTLAASTKSLGDRVEIRIRDNGTGVPSDVKEKMFNPFFTTKPAGEGTGLGLSISHDIIVKQHGGSIEVDTQPGEFTEIKVILPRVTVFV
jgi:two-component system, NtrC family, sensor kinase